MSNIEVAAISAVLAFVLLIIFVLVRQFTKTEYWVRNKAKFDMFRVFINAAIIQVADAWNSADSAELREEYEAKAELWSKPKEAGGKGIKLDPRMWAVLDKVEKSVFRNIVEFDVVVTIIEGAYQMLRKSDNGLVLNPDKDIVDAVEAEYSVEHIPTN